MSAGHTAVEPALGCMRLLCLLALTACAVDDVDDPELSTIDSELTASQWDSGTLMKDVYGELHTDAGFALASYANNLWAAFPVNGTGLLRTVRFDGTKWSRSGDLMHTDDGFGLVAYNNQLVAIVTSGSRWYMFTRTAEKYTPWSAAVELTPSHHTYSRRIGLAVHSGKLYVGSTDGGKVVLDRLDGTTLTKLWSHSMDHNWDEDVSLASFGGKLHAYWTDPVITQGFVFPYGVWGDIYHYKIRELTASPGSTYVVDNDIGMESIHSPAVTVCNGYVHMLHVGSSINNNQIWWSARSTTSTSWGNDYKLPNATTLLPDIACNVYVIPTMLYGSYDTSRMWYAEFR